MCVSGGGVAQFDLVVGRGLEEETKVGVIHDGSTAKRCCLFRGELDMTNSPALSICIISDSIS